MKPNKLKLSMRAIVLAMTFGVSASAIRSTDQSFEALELMAHKDIVPVVSPNADGRPILGVAFGGGGVRGFMHLGVLKAFDEAGIRPDIVTGSSVGSFAAAMYGSGLSITDIERIVRDVDQLDLADPVIDLSGALEGKAIARWVNETLENIQLQDMRIPVGITVTDLSTHQSFLVQKGNTGQAVQSSSTIPGVFVPVEKDDHVLVDGALLAVVPVRYARAMGADVVIGIDIFCHNAQPPKPYMIPILMATFRMQSCALGADEMAEADILLQPDYEPNFAGSFAGRDVAIQAGYDAARAAIPAVMNKLTHTKD